MKEKMFKTLSTITIRAGYYPLLFLLSCIWRIYYNPGLDSISMISFIAQQAAIFSMLQIADSIVKNTKIRYSIAGVSAVYIFLLHLNALLLSITSMTLRESIAVLAIGGDFLYTLEEAGLSTGFIFLLILILLLIASGGAFSYKKMPHVELSKKSYNIAILTIFFLSSLFFITEQISGRNNTDFFARRNYPLYIEMFSSNRDTMTFNISSLHNPAPESYNKIVKSENPKNVLFIILESFRGDSINKELSPFMAEFAEQSLKFDNYYTDAIYTSLAWNTLLMDKPAYSLSSDIDYDKENRSGSGIFRIFKKAGYDTYAVFSANMEWKNFYQRVNGKDKLIDNYFCAYQTREEERNFIDTRTSSRSAEWIARSKKDKPFFMMIQLDSTHWTYYADEENRISKPYAGKDINIGKLRNPADIDLLRNRYKNSVRQINMEIEKIINALKLSGKYNDTAIIIVSDHGEGFSPGMIGHSVLHNEIKKPAFLIRLPGLEKFSTDKFISHMDIFPTLFDFLKIKGTDDIMRGRSILDKNNNRESVLSFHGSSMLADLSFKDYSVYFRVTYCNDSISFTPVNITDKNGKIIPGIDGSRWKDELNRIFSKK